TTVVELPPATAGSYTLTCGMGMMSGQLRVGAVADGSPNDTGGIVLVLALVGTVAAGAALARTAPKGDTAQHVLGLDSRELMLAVIGIVIAVLAGLVFSGVI
ncbi:MAG: hypothetical protein Q8M55_02275, partial [Actinomycetota bacterium]|nr:hypothetical protein [Actinomycetota bacterium]